MYGKYKLFTYFLCTKISTFHNELIIEIAFDIIFCPAKGAVFMINCVALITIRCDDCVLADKYYTAEEQGEELFLIHNYHFD